MANEITINESLTIQATDPTTGIVQIYYRPPDTSFRADMTGRTGPSPGLVVATAAGTDVSLTAVGGGGGMARLKNQSLVNYVEFGPYDPATDIYMPLGEILPGEFTRIRLSRFLGQEFGLTGTFIKGTGVTLRLKGVGGSVNVLVEVFPK